MDGTGTGPLPRHPDGPVDLARELDERGGRTAKDLAARCICAVVGTKHDP